MESRVEEIIAQRRAYVSQQTVLQYHALLTSLIRHHAADAGGHFQAFHNHLEDDCFSTRLNQLLNDLADIESQCLNNVDLNRDHRHDLDRDIDRDPDRDRERNLDRDRCDLDLDRDRDRDAVLTLAGELSLGWWSGTTTLCVDGQRTVVPNVSDVRYEKLLLYDAATSPHFRQLSVDDVEEQLDNSTQ